jgi:hypothetical protein
MRLFSDKRLSFFILVFLPLSISIVALTQKVPYFVFAGLAYLVISIVYGFYPIRYNAIRYFKDREPQNAVAEYEFVKRIVYIEIPIVVVIAAITILVVPNYEANPLTNTFSALSNNLIMDPQTILETLKNPHWGIFAPINTFSYSVTGGIIWLTIQTRKKYFDFYLAKAYFQIIDKKEDPTNKVSCLIRGIKSYDSYLRKSLDLQINTDEIFSRIIGNVSIDTDKTIKEISEFFNDDYNKLKPIKCISNILKIKETEKILNEESLEKKLGDRATLLGTIVAILTSLIQTILPAFGNP